MARATATSSPPAADATAVRERQRAIWDGVAAAWGRWSPCFERGAAVVTRRLLRLGAVTAGARVLDVGSGTGEPALSAARAVGPAGRVVGYDVSPRMLAAARAAAADAANVEFRLGDVATADLAPGSFDVALSRWGLMFAADRVELLRAVAGSLVPGGALAAAVWGAPERVPMVSLGFRVIARRLELAPAPGPGPFTMCDPEVVAAELDAAGFGAIDVHELTVPFELESVAAFVRFSRDVLPPPMRRLLEERCGAVDDPDVWAAVADAARAYEAPGGAVRLPSTCLCIRAVAG